MAKKILLIEDDTLLLDLVQNKLKEYGYDVLGKQSGEDGLEVIAEFFPDLILLDMLLPGIDGIQTLEQIKKNPKSTEIPVIIISNSGQPVELGRAEQLGARDWLIKVDFDLDELIDKIIKQIGKP
ncbi:MAG TPA: response regulator [Candidatus Pacearchaeota archaeon]|nr:response regulator [Candidatus Parcubacteria bacterium]HNZ83702.1 response regulator [Candidatus Pacearchaeota archaeon]HOU45620.1 response regulator [Candidatus Pacearchaeota archaeon]HPM08318.1 response regulator [Candidatus Pacearchaeota archaeon]HQI74805.1 response regulator [Candidatus Pacearchaeota archaeon]